jgi:hypothetical protein
MYEQSEDTRTDFCPPTFLNSRSLDSPSTHQFSTNTRAKRKQNTKENPPRDNKQSLIHNDIEKINLNLSWKFPNSSIRMLLTTLPNPIISSPTHTSYPYPIQSRLKTHTSILSPLSPHAYGHTGISQGGPGPSTKEAQAERRERHKLAFGRAEARALAGKRPTGVDMGKEAEEMSDDDQVMEDDKVGFRSVPLDALLLE